MDDEYFLFESNRKELQNHKVPTPTWVAMNLKESQKKESNTHVD
jgi:hypothetical protein